MKKKWTPHIIAAGVFVVIIVLSFLACVSITPEQREEWIAQSRAQEEARASDGKGGVIIVRHNGNKNDNYQFKLIKPSQREKEWKGDFGLFSLDPSFPTKLTVDEDGTYMILYKNKKGMNPDEIYTKTFYVSNDRTVEVSIP